MNESIRPIFVVGSYRSGTSVFAWCMGQHPNIVPLPETNWLARLTLDIDNLYRLGTINGYYSHLTQTGLSKDDFYKLFGEGIERLIQKSNPTLLGEVSAVSEGQFGRRRSADDPKGRWLDATPENSHYIYALAKLFPEAQFIHLLRDPHEVARSLMRFSRTGSNSKDFSQDSAYRAWLRLTRDACKAEYALGRRRMIRVAYRELVDEPERVFREVLAFLGEPFCEYCELPLTKKINSSGVDAEALPPKSAAGLQAQAYYESIVTATPPGRQGDADAYAELEWEFRKRCQDEQDGQFATVVRRLNSEMHAVYRSTSWRVTAPLRMVVRPVRTLWQLRHLNRSILRLLLRDIYYHLPLSLGARAAVRRVAAQVPGISRLLIAQPRARGGSRYRIKGESVDTSQVERFLAEPEEHPVSLPTHDSPEVSVVIPVYNNIAHTLHCLRSIEAVGAGIPFELIVVDDCSTDETQEVLARCEGLRVIKNTSNLGFIGACNVGASAARGKYLYFLNNDTQVLDGWLDELYGTFQAVADAGLVGSRLIYPDGRLQEAGGIIWRDGSGWNYGKFDEDPDRPEYSYLRDVDYVSGASIMVPRQQFSDLGGFDAHYAPAYCEDTDLAFKLRKRGFRILYQPLSVVVHYEGISSGTDLSSGIKQHQAVNQRKFLERWRCELSAHRPNGIDPLLEKDRGITKRLLFIDACTPRPDHDAGSGVAVHYMRIFQRLGYQVTFAPDNLLHDGEYTRALQRMGIECLYVPYCPSLKSHLRKHGRRYDVVLMHRPYVASQYIRLLRRVAPEVCVIYNTVDLHYLREQRQAEVEGNPLLAARAKRTKIQELAVINSADAAIVVSDVEKQLLDREAPQANVHVVQLIFDEQPEGPTFEEREDILFIGGYRHPPNIDAAKYFVEQVLPLVQRRLPAVKFFALGANPPPELQALSSRSVIIPGFVPDVTPYFNKCRLMVAPLRFGAGIKGKIGSSLASGLPVVATSIAAEGMRLQNRRHLLIADQPDQLADAICELYSTETLWRSLAAAGRNFVKVNYSPLVVQGHLQEVLRSATSRMATKLPRRRSGNV